MTGRQARGGLNIKTLQASFHWAREYVRRVPDIRGEKVREIRRRISSGAWNPKSTRIAERILHEHLWEP
jgi:anti-sigma28 factor (negative regulator of flagellin synthesis)